MSDVTRLLEAANRGDRQAAADLLPLVYAELRALAAARVVAEPAGHTLQATALVHEAYLRLVGDQHFNGRGHFFGAAAEAMRRILVESARRKARLKRGGDGQRVEMPDDLPAPAAPVEDVLAVDEALDQLCERDATAAELVKLHYFAGFTLEEAADLLGVPHRTAYRTWSFARAWLFRRLGGEGAREENPPTG
ncbi:MAG: sigma-70 family RNA polymerase sigma factor [Gemmataceae bacterium]|nr:sigma-70 family RNA polymerase sigma factor [Gemmataceae bacterium]